MKQNRKDLMLGLGTGLIVPIFGMLCWYFLYFERKGIVWDQVVSAFQTGGMLRTRIMVLGLIFIIPLFMYFYNRNNMGAMRGVILAMFIYALIIVFFMLS